LKNTCYKTGKLYHIFELKINFFYSLTKKIIKMKKSTTLLKKLFITVCLCSATGLNAANNDVIVPSFVKIQQPVPAEETEQDKEGKYQFYHIRNSHASWGDYDNDGYLDVFYGGRNDHIEYWAPEKNVLYKNRGDETFELVFVPNGDGQMLRAGYWGCPVWFDFNNDGYLDLLVAGVNWSGSKDSFCRLYQNMGANEDGDFIFEQFPNAGGIRRFMNEDDGGKSHQYISVGDYDKDGYIDVVVTGFGIVKEDEGLTGDDYNENARTERMLRLYKNDRGTGFIEIETPLDNTDVFKGLSGGSVNFADMDNDGWLDIVGSGYGTGPEMYVYWNNGDGTFSKEAELELTGSFNSGSGIFDFNNDGLIDILVTGFAPEKDMFIYENKGDRTFTLIDKAAAGFEGLDGGQIAFGDVNHDGLSDILLGGHGEQHEITTWIYLNKGDGTFEQLLNPVTRVSHGTQSLIDANNDGILDVFVLGWTNNSVCDRECTAELWKGTPDNGINAAPSVPAGLNATYRGEAGRVTLTWEASTDDVTHSNALQYNIFVKKQGSSEIFMTVPADITSGFIKVGEFSGQITQTLYDMSIEADENDIFEWGVQAIDNAKKGSTFATSTFSTNGTGLNPVFEKSANVYTSGGVIFYKLLGKATITVIDLSGKVVTKKAVGPNGKLEGLNRGFYILNIVSDSGIVNKSVIL
jgi:hypothetical protein